MMTEEIDVFGRSGVIPATGYDQTQTALAGQAKELSHLASGEIFAHTYWMRFENRKLEL